MSNLNLRHSVIKDFWNSRDERMGIVLQWMEDMEDMEEWSLDKDPDFSRALEELAGIMERASRQAMLGKLDGLLNVMAYMSSSRAMRLLEWFDERYQNGLSLELIQQARQQPSDPCHQIMLDRLRALQSLSLLGKIFDPKRVHHIIQLLRETGGSGDPIEGRGRF